MSTDIEVVEPKGKVKRGRVTDHALDKAARELNMLTVSAKGLRGFTVIGRFLEQLGVVNYGNGRLVATAEAIANAQKVCADLAARENLPAQMREQFLELQLRLAERMDENIALMVKVNEAPAVESAKLPQQVKPFALNSVVPPLAIPLQVNVTNNLPPQEKKKD